MKERSIIKYNLIKLLICIVIAVLVFVFRENLVDHLKVFIGCLMISYALEETIFALLFHTRHILHEEKIYLSFVELILGVVMLCVNLSVEAVCVIWATWSIIRESYEIKEIACDLKHLLPKIISGVESITVIVFSILLIVNPGHHHAMIHLYLLLAELVVTPLTPLLDELLDKKK